MANIMILTPFQERIRKIKGTNKQWIEYEERLRANYNETNEKNKNYIDLNDKRMEYEFTIKGNEPISGFPLYICLHDGEVARAAYNTGEYNKMKSYYVQSIDVGICLATRGISDLSNQHYVDESYLIYEELIRKMIITEKADPNRVYLVGVGLGGNAVYQIATRISDRFAAVSINTGHSFGINVKNLFNIPIQIQVGENDYLFDRNKDAVKTYYKLVQLHKEMHMNLQSFFECNIHCNRNNTLKDNLIKSEFQPVKNDPIGWMKGEVPSELRNTNAISFLKRHIRNPYPKRLVWDLTKVTNYIMSDIGDRKEVYHEKYSNALEKKDTITTDKKDSLYEKNNYAFGKTKTLTEVETKEDHNPTEAFREQREKRFRVALLNRNTVSTLNINQHYYWLEIGTKTLYELGVVEVIVQFDKETNTITVETPIKYLRILLNEEMIDFEKEVDIEYAGIKKTIFLSKNFKTERRIIKERGDYTYVFQACIVIESKDHVHFKIYQYEEPFNDY